MLYQHATVLYGMHVHDKLVMQMVCPIQAFYLQELPHEAHAHMK